MSEKTKTRLSDEQVQHVLDVINLFPQMSHVDVAEIIRKEFPVSASLIGVIRKAGSVASYREALEAKRKRYGFGSEYYSSKNVGVKPRKLKPLRESKPSNVHVIADEELIDYISANTEALKKLTEELKQHRPPRHWLFGR